MSMFWCSRCDDMKDADDGCDEAPGKPLELICIECVMALEEEAADLEDELSDMTTRERYGYRAETEWFGPAKLEGDR